MSAPAPSDSAPSPGASDSQADSANGARERPRPRWMRFSLKTLLVLFVATSLGMAWYVRNTHRQYNAMREVERLGGSAEFVLVVNENLPAWLRPLVDKRYSIQVSRVYFKPLNQFRDKHMGNLAAFTALKELNLTAVPITDQSLNHLSGLKNLKLLRLSRTKVSDRGIQKLSALRRLGRLYVDQTQVTDKGVRRLRKFLPGCRIIY